MPITSRPRRVFGLALCRLNDEAGYSLVEVMVSIMLLSIAIIPMVAMFDVGLQSATTSGNYDRARAFANQRLENVKDLPYDTARTSFPNASCTPSGASTATCSDITAGVPQGLDSYSVGKRFVNEQLQNTDEDEGLMKVSVTVEWGGNDYTATGVVGR